MCHPTAAIEVSSVCFCVCVCVVSKCGRASLSMRVIRKEVEVGRQ